MKINQLADINFWANIVTIASIFLALFVFWDDKYQKQQEEKQQYLNQLESLKFELTKNNNVILGFFYKEKQAWIKGTKIAYFRYSTGVTNKLISEGIIRDKKLLRNLDAISDNQNQVNRILDLLSLMAQTSQIGSQDEREMFQKRILDASQTIVNLNNQIEQYLPMVINDLSIHIEETEEM